MCIHAKRKLFTELHAYAGNHTFISTIKVDAHAS